MEFIYIYIYIYINVIMITTQLPDIIRKMLIYYSLYSCTTCTKLRTLVPNITKAYVTSNSFSLTFPIIFLMTIMPMSISLVDPRNLTGFHIFSLSYPLFMHRDSSSSYTSCWVSLHSTWALLSFLFPQSIPKTLKT